jgi:oligopeptidase A
MLAEVSAFFAKIPLNEHLWDLLVTYSKTEEAKKLTPVRKRALDESMEGFIQAGADLPPEKKKRVEEIESELSKLTQKYSENVLDSTNKWELVIDDVNRSKACRRPPSKPREPMPPRKASAHRRSPCTAFTLKAPSMIPVMEYLEDEGIRRQVWEGASGIGRGGEHDNTELVWNILRLRHEKAQIMGKANFADHVLAHRMAKTGRSALRFIEDLYSRVNEAFKRETIELQEFRADTAHQVHRPVPALGSRLLVGKTAQGEVRLRRGGAAPLLPARPRARRHVPLAEKVFDLRITDARSFTSSRARRAWPASARSLERPAPSRSGILR